MKAVVQNLFGGHIHIGKIGAKIVRNKEWTFFTVTVQCQNKRKGKTTFAHTDVGLHQLYVGFRVAPLNQFNLLKRLLVGGAVEENRKFLPVKWF